MPRVKRKPSTGTRKGPRAKRLPGLARVQTKSANRTKALPKEPPNPVIDDGEFDFDRPPDVLNIDGVKMWRSAVKVLRTVGELYSHHHFGLEVLCYHFQRIRKRQRADQDIPTNERNTFNRLLVEYGMTPAGTKHLDSSGKLRKNGPPVADTRPPKVFEEQDLPVEGEEKERANRVSKLEDKASSLL